MDALAACQEFIKSNDAQQIAAKLREDAALCRAGGRPSFVVCLLPTAFDDKAEEISRYLRPKEDAHSYEGLARSVREIWYLGLISGIRSYLNQMSILKYMTLDQPTVENCSLSPSIHPLDEYKPQIQRKQTEFCYICRLENRKAHSSYPALCEMCGSFNLGNSLISLPGSLDLRGKIALVTGGRINLGFVTALRLLRCGAKVIVSSRYPQDAEARYSAEEDSGKWSDRLKIVGADFRTAQDAFDLVKLVVKQVKLWSKSGHLDILINNAAQTLTDSIQQEMRAIKKEGVLKRTNPKADRLLGSQYEARIRGGNNSHWKSSLQWQGDPDPQQESDKEGYAGKKDHDFETETMEAAGEVVQEDLLFLGEPTLNSKSKSSWAQSMDEIPYEDLMTAHSVNFFVPLILCRELLLIMSKSRCEFNTDKDESHIFDDNGNVSDQEELSNPETCRHEAKAANAYIINVSSREGIFESRIGARAKNAKHVHTNTSKAALNMITETEADNCWRKHKVAMNTVDPGYMSAAPEMQHLGDCPITFEDGAARVLWPIAVAEIEGKISYGRFLKHFGAVEVDVGAGR